MQGPAGTAHETVPELRAATCAWAWWTSSTGLPNCRGAHAAERGVPAVSGLHCTLATAFG